MSRGDLAVSPMSRVGARSGGTLAYKQNSSSILNIVVIYPVSDPRICFLQNPTAFLKRSIRGVLKTKCYSTQPIRVHYAFYYGVRCFVRFEHLGRGFELYS
jgi:hypothetical protein